MTRIFQNHFPQSFNILSVCAEVEFTHLELRLNSLNAFGIAECCHPHHCSAPLSLDKMGGKSKKVLQQLNDVWDMEL